MGAPSTKKRAHGPSQISGWALGLEASTPLLNVHIDQVQSIRNRSSTTSTATTLSLIKPYINSGTYVTFTLRLMLLRFTNANLPKLFRNFRGASKTAIFRAFWTAMTPFMAVLETTSLKADCAMIRSLEELARTACMADLG
ncbi:MAG: hypothetical protein ACJAXK_001627 [Yoonia sp.]|jgi:hypothetical protein